MNRKQNKGFTLVEVLIAMTILGIIVVPLLHAFVTSANTNAKSKRIMDATGLAQNIMEELKAGSLEDLAKQFNAKRLNLTVENPVLTVGGDLSEESQEYGTPGEKYYSVSEDGKNFIGQTSGKYNFLMRNVSMDNSKYDVVIHLEESLSKELANVNSMNQSDCGYYAQTENMDQRAAAEFQVRNAAYVYEAAAQKTTDEFKKMMKRTITVSIKKYTVDVTYRYEVPIGYTAEEDRTFEETTRIYHDLAGVQSPKAVYLYYYPLFSNRGDAEVIIVDNTENLDVDVFLIKMQKTESGNRPQPYLDLRTSLSDMKVHSNDIFNSDKVVNSLLLTEEVTSLYDVTVSVYSYQEDNSLVFKNDYLLGSYTGSLLDDSVIVK